MSEATASVEPFVGPTTMDCPQKCEVPAGAKLTPCPTPRHNWGDVIVCPHADCEQAFLVTWAWRGVQ